jgi:hypothetical protein
VGAVCGKAARTGLCGGRSEMSVPTAIAFARNDEEAMLTKKAAVTMTAGFLGTQQALCRPGCFTYDVALGKRGADALLGRSNDFGGDAADAAQAENAGGTLGQVQNPAAHEWTAIVDRDDDAAVAMADPKFGAEWQRAVGAGHGILVEMLAGGGPAAGFIAVIRRDAGEAAT